MNKLVFSIVGLGVVFGCLLLAFSSEAATAVGSGPGSSEDGVWRDVSDANLRLSGERIIVPQQYRTLHLNLEALRAQLAAAPLKFAAAAQTTSMVIWLPLPDGAYGRFQIVESPVMHPDLTAKFPGIKTYAGRGLDDPTASMRLDVTPAGFHAMILSADGRVFIDPYTNRNTGFYISYHGTQLTNTELHNFMPPDVPVTDDTGESITAVNGVVSSGGQLRTYRLALAATGEYTQYHGGVLNALAAIVTTVNRVTGIYEREVAVRLELIANNDLIVYDDPATDPYTNIYDLSQNQNNLDSTIGNANYDVGHVVSTDDGGLASLGVVCNSFFKARGATGLPNPVGDPFDVDYLSHELGHQFDANHTFNGTAGSCFGSNRNAATAYEPGSGTTIMAYAGICGAQNIQSNSDDHFHGASFDEIVAYTTTSTGNVCAAVTGTGNTPPTVDAGSSYTIPAQTPFTLTGSATDPDPTASLTYVWEEFDLGPAGHPNFPSGDAPLFRSFSPTSLPARTFPQLSDILSNTRTMGEILPQTSRTLNFRLTARDNQTPAGGVAYDTTTVDVVGSAGPFRVSSFNTAVTLTGYSSQTVTWDVAGTTAAPISCASVDILLSDDGGATFAYHLALNTPNDGSQTILFPNLNTTSARIKVACANNIFFDISDANLTILPVSLSPQAFLPIVVRPIETGQGR